MTNSAGLAPAEIPTPKPRPGRALANTALFLLACAGICALLGWLAPFPAVPGIFPKWEWFNARRDEFDVLFIGSSRFFHQVIPAQFDAEVAQAGGSKVRSFNFAYDGAWPPESYYLLRRILALRPARLKWVVIELKDIDVQLDARNTSTMRMAYWHDARHTRLAFDDILDSGRPDAEKRELLAGHGRLFVQHALNLGRGADLLNKLLIVPRPRRQLAWETHAGYDPETTQMTSPEVLAHFRAGLDRMKKMGPAQPVRPVLRDALSAVIADVRRAGAEPIFVIAPTVNPVENYGHIPDGAPLWTYNRPDEHPALYDPVHRYDSWHLNHDGAVRFTALLAARFAAHARMQP